MSVVPNSVTVTCVDKSIGNQGVVVGTRNDLPGSLRNSTDTAAIEAFINNFLKTALTFTDGDGLVRWKFYAAVHVVSNTGGVLIFNAIAVDFTGLATDPAPVTGTWWAA